MQVHDFANELRQVVVDDIQFKLARFNLRDVEYVIDYMNQRMGRFPNGFHVLLLLTVKGALDLHEFRHADHTVQGCSYLMAHIR